jgi:tetratricopeptide (TPR) repeat protein
MKEYLLNGNESFYRQDYAEAIKWYDKALEIKPDYIDALHNKGASLIFLTRKMRLSSALIRL